MRKMTYRLVAVASLLSSFAYGSDFAISQFSCGDHWFEVNVDLKPESKSAMVQFSGDSNPQPSELTGTYEVQGDASLVVYLSDDRKHRIELDGSDHPHNIFWGAYHTESGVQNLGLCSVQ
jgi:hypothetical protein